MRRTYLACLLASASVTILAAPAFAADAPPPQQTSTTVGEVVVTAEKRAEPLKDIPMSVTALAGGALDKLNDTNFADYAALVPGLSLESVGPGETRLTLRGQNAGGVGSTVAVYVDESPFGSSTALLNGSILAGNFDPWDMHGIEVLRGPQGTLYGANSEGGLLKFVTNAPVLGNYSAAVEASDEDIDGGGNGWSIKGMANIPLGDKAAVRITAFDQDLPGWVNDPNLGLKDANKATKVGGRISVLFNPTDNFSVRLTAIAQDIKANATPAEDIDPFTNQPVNGENNQTRFLKERSGFKYQNYNATLNWNLGFANLTSTTSYGILDQTSFSDDTSAVLIPPTTTLGEFLDANFGGNLGGGFVNDTYLKKFTEEVRLTSPSGGKFEWQIGGYYTHEKAALSQNLQAFDLPSGALDPSLPDLEIISLDSTYTEWAGFASGTYHFSPQFDIQAGGRYSSNKQSVTESISGALAGNQSFSTPSSGNVFTYSIAPQWHVDANTMIYARLATGFRPGGPNALPPAAPPDVEREYGADSTINYELGIRSTQMDGRLSIDVAVFHVDWKNIQILQVVDNFGINANGGKARSQGVEWTIGLVPVEGLRLTWDGAYTDAILTSQAPAIGGAPGDPLPWAPKWSTALDAEYDWNLTDNFRAFVGGTWAYVGSRSTDFGSAALPDGTFLTPSGQATLSSYDTLALRAGIERDNWRIQLYGKNLGDARGITAYGAGGTPNLNGELGVIQPRTFGVTVSAKFN
jgi:iron complex outermembrane receptor protein